ncbi:MAG: type II toxin-antitoxin system RelE family toxin [Acidimicrobiales bacterium]
MSPEPYEVSLNRSARRALAETLPLDVAIGMSDFITGPLGDNPYRVGRELHAPADGIYAAHVMREWRVLYAIDDENRSVTVRDIRHRRDAYRTP